MIDYSLILTTNYADKQWIFAGDSYDGLDWHDESPKPTKEELDSQWYNVKIQAESKEYQYKRALEYPKITDQLDMLYHDIKNGTLETGNWIQSVESVKEKYPKPE